jgi:hypothetical protein
MAWVVEADATFWASVWAIHKGLSRSYSHSGGAADDRRLKVSLAEFKEFFELIDRFIEGGQIGVGAWFPAKFGDEIPEDIYRLQIEGNPLMALFKVEGRPIFGAKAIFALRDPPTPEQLKVIEDRLAAASQGTRPTEGAEL